MITLTFEMLKKIAPYGKDDIIRDVVKYFNQYAASYGVDSYLRVCHFLAQATHESDGFKTLREYWGPTAAQKGYEGRKDLGNTQPGDGYRYRGRGIFQLTGRANYREMSKKIGTDIEANPDLAGTAEISVLTALEYWKSRGLSTHADADDVLKITKRINGGTNGLDDRKGRLAIAKSVIPQSDIGTVNLSIGSKGPAVSDMQANLIKKGFPVKLDGDFGPKTRDALKAYQKSIGLPETGIADATTLERLKTP